MSRARTRPDTSNPGNSGEDIGDSSHTPDPPASRKTLQNNHEEATTHRIPMSTCEIHALKAFHVPRTAGHRRSRSVSSLMQVAAFRAPDFRRTDIKHPEHRFDAPQIDSQDQLGPHGDNEIGRVTAANEDDENQEARTVRDRDQR